MGVESDLVDLVLASRDGDGPAGAGRADVAEVNLPRRPEDTRGETRESWSGLTLVSCL